MVRGLVRGAGVIYLFICLFIYLTLLTGLDRIMTHMPRERTRLERNLREDNI